MSPLYTTLVLLVVAFYVFFSYIFVGAEDADNKALPLATVDDVVQSNTQDLQAEFSNLAGLFDFEYSKLESDNNETLEKLGDIPVAVKFIVISGDYSKVKIEAEVADQMQKYDLEIGDLLLEYELVEISERFVRFSKDDKDHIVKIFKPNVLATTLDN